MTNIRSISRIAFLAFSAGLVLSACSSGDDEDGAAANAARQSDPALTGALAEQIMTDTDLISQNRANNAATFGPQDGSLPTLDSSPKAIGAARGQAMELVGGSSKMQAVPDARRVSDQLPAGVALSVVARAAASGQSAAQCAGAAQYSAAWAAKMPDGFPVYPLAAVQEAAGNEAQGCQLRAINFLTPVSLKDILDFYYTSALAAGYSAEHIMQDGVSIVGGVKGDASFVVYASSFPDGSTQVDLVTNGS